MCPATLETRPLSPKVGVEVLDVDLPRLRRDEGLPSAVLTALEEHGVLLFRNLRIDDDTQIAFSKKLGPVRTFPDTRRAEIFDVGWNSSNPYSEYLRGNVSWHFDGLLDQEVPTQIGVLSAKVVSTEGGETEFASSYEAYNMLTESQKEFVRDRRVVFSYEASQRRVFKDPSPELIAEWRKRDDTKTYPLVWTHESGRRSLVLSSTMDHIVGLDVEEGRSLLDGLMAQATTPDRIYRHTWEVGDTVIYNNAGLYHRATSYDPSSERELHRTTIGGHEPIR